MAAHVNRVLREARMACQESQEKGPPQGGKVLWAEVCHLLLIHTLKSQLPVPQNVHEVTEFGDEVCKDKLE